MLICLYGEGNKIIPFRDRGTRLWGGKMGGGFVGWVVSGYDGAFLYLDILVIR